MEGMRRYANLHGNSGVSEYLPAKDSLTVLFRDDDKLYVYSYAITGTYHVDIMKSLAAAGRGLATYIAKNRNLLKFSTVSKV